MNDVTNKTSHTTKNTHQTSTTEFLKTQKEKTIQQKNTLNRTRFPSEHIACQTPNNTQKTIKKPKQKIVGGSVQAGTTSNKELDAIVAQLTNNCGRWREERSDKTRKRGALWVAPCDAYHREECEDFNRALHDGSIKQLLLPIFTRSHWLLAVIEKDATSKNSTSCTATILDSAPSPPVRRDISRCLPKMFNNLSIEHATAPRQARDSEDCGIFMVAAICTCLIQAQDPSFSAHSDPSLPARLRKYLAGNKSIELNELRSILTTTAQPRRTLLRGGSDTDDMGRRMARHPAATAIWRRACALDTLAADQNLCHLLAASALEALVNNTRWTATIKSLETRAKTAGYPRIGQCQDGRPRFAQQALTDSLKVPLHFWGDTSPGTATEASVGKSSNPTYGLMGPVEISNARRFVVVTAPDEAMMTHLPETMEATDGAGARLHATFILGSVFLGHLTETFGGTNPQIGNAGAKNGHYAITLLPSRATIGVYEVNPAKGTNPDGTLARQRKSTNTSEKQQDDDVTIIERRGAQEMPHHRLVEVLKAAKTGDRISLTWQKRTNEALDPNQNKTWTGTIEAEWAEHFHSVAVLWDKDMQALGTKRRRVLPEAVLPDPEIVYIAAAVIPPPGQVDQPPQKSHTQVPKKQSEQRIRTKRPSRTAQPAETNNEKCATGGTTTRDILTEPTSRTHASTLPNGKGRLDHGDRVCPRAWYIFPERPPHISKLAWESCSPGVRKQHVKWLREIRSMPADLLPPVPLAQAVLELIRRMAITRRWKWSTVERAMASAKSALAHITLYTNVAEPIAIDKDPEWRAAKKGALKFKNETPPNPPPPISYGEYMTARNNLRSDPKAALLLAMLWAFAARSGDITGLTPECINIGEETQDGLGKLAITIRRGKGACFRGPYPIASMMQRNDLNELRRWLAQTPKTKRIFEETTTLKNRVRRAIQTGNPAASLPSVRKGAARHLAATGMTEEELMQVLGHTRIETTRQYLGYSEHLTANQRRAQERTRALQCPGPQTTTAGETGRGNAAQSH